jgi:hypothetical protein
LGKVFVEVDMFKKILNLIGLINLDPENKSLILAERLIWLKWKVFLRGYVVGLVLYPWVWVWGFWVLFAGLLFYLTTQQNIIYTRYVVTFGGGLGLEGTSDYYQIGYYIFGSLVLFINYTVSYVTYRKNTAIGILIWILSMWLVFSSYALALMVWRFNLR